MPATEPACSVDALSAAHGFDTLAVRLAEYLSPEQIDKIARAYAIAASAHSGQTRKSGEDYITHPVAVAGILAELHLDEETLCAAILHDALEDTPLSRADIAEAFGDRKSTRLNSSH